MLKENQFLIIKKSYTAKMMGFISIDTERDEYLQEQKKKMYVISTIFVRSNRLKDRIYTKEEQF